MAKFDFSSNNTPAVLESAENNIFDEHVFGDSALKRHAALGLNRVFQRDSRRNNFPECHFQGIIIDIAALTGRIHFQNIQTGCFFQIAADGSGQKICKHFLRRSLNCRTFC